MIDRSLPRGYLDHACLGVPSRETATAVSAAVGELSVSAPDATAQSVAWIEQAASARASLASLFATAENDITLVQNTTDGLATVLAAIPWRSGDAVVVADREFLAAVTVCRSLAKARGLEVRVADGPAPAQLAPHLDGRVRAVVVSAVAEVSGVRADLGAVCEACSSVRAALVVDGAQEAGVLTRHLPSSGADAYTATGHKWLRAPFGTGVLWTSPDLRDRLIPQTRGYLALAEPEDGWAVYLGSRDRDARDPLPFRSDGAALESGGTPSWIGSLGLAAAVTALLDAGPANIAGRAMELAARLRDGIIARGHERSLVDPAGTSPLVSLAVNPLATSLQDDLGKRGIRASVRGALGNRVLRVSCHGWNDADDVDLVLEAIDDGDITLVPRSGAR